MARSRFDEYDDTRDGDNSWRGEHHWAIPAAPRKRSPIDTGQARHTFRILRENFRKQCQAAQEPCWLDGNAIDYTIRTGPRAFELDHAVPVSVDPSLALEPSNFRAAHSLCNRRRQAGAAEADPRTDVGIPSEEW